MADFLKFRNETNRYATFASSLTLNIGTGAYQFEFKARMISLPPSGSVGVIGTNSASTASGILISSAGELRVLSSGTERYKSATGFILNDGNWHVYRIEHDAGGAWRMYRDNLVTPISTGTFTTSTSANNFNAFGRSSTASTTYLDADVEYFLCTGSITNADEWDANISDLMSSTWTAVGGNNATLQAGFPTDGSQWGTESSVIPVSFTGTIANQTFTVGDTVDVDLTTGFSGTETPFTYANTGTSLAGSGLSINSSGHLVGTAIESSTTGVIVTATDTGTNTADSNAFNVNVVPPTGNLEIDTVSDLSNISSVSSTVTSPESAEPTVFLVPRAATNTFSPTGEWRNLVAKLTGCAGKRPFIRFDRATQESTTSARDTNWRIYWTTDFVTFNAFPAADTSSGSAGYYQVQTASAFTDDIIYVMTNPMKPNAVKGDYIAALIAANPSIITPTASAVAYKLANPSAPDNACYVQPSILYPTESGEAMSGQQIGQTPVWSFTMNFGGGTTDGGAKRTAILGQGQHSQGEDQSFMSLMGFLDYIINDPAAASLRSNFIFHVYVNINGSGIKGGHKRLGYESVNDYNREWLKGSPLATIAAVRSAMLSDCGGSADVLLDFHGTAYNRGDYNNIHSSVYEPANNATWNTLIQSYINTTNADVSTVDDVNGYIINWAYTALGVKYATHAEHANRGNNSPSNFAVVGKAWAQTLQAADTGGMFYVAPPDTFNISIASTLPLAISSGSLTSTVPEYNISFDSVLPKLTSSMTLGLSVPEYNISIGSTLPKISSNGTLESLVPEYTLSISSNLPLLTSNMLLGSESVPEYNIQINSNLPSINSSIAMTFVVPEYNLIIDSSLPKLSSSIGLNSQGLTYFIPSGNMIFIKLSSNTITL